jgi:ribosomal protein L37AE/L43A
MSEKTCDICGYTSSSIGVIQEFPDGIFRCQVCKDIAAHGKYISDRERKMAKKSELSQWNKEYDEWYKGLT